MPLVQGMNALAVAILAAGIPITGGPISATKGFQVAAQTTNFVFLTRDAKPVDAEKNQRFLDETSQRLGVQVVGQSAYYRYAWPEEIGFAIGTNAAGAALTTGEILSTRAFDAHEIVHRVALQLGDPGALFNEGLAVELGDHGRVANVKVDGLARKLVGRVPFRSLADRFLSLEPGVRYPLAGSFMRFLVKRHGLDKVTAFFRACGTKGEGRDARFAEQFGQSLDDAGHAWIASLRS